MNNPVYDLMISNCRSYLKKSNPHSPDHLNAFKLSEVIAIALCKTKEDVIMDIINKE